MTIRCDADRVFLAGSCGVEEVETLVEHLESHPDAAVDIGAATAIHTALWQALMIFKPEITGSPASPAVGAVLPALRRYFDETGKT